MIVVGGTYAEICRTPARPREEDLPLLGSGVRAVVALRRVSPAVELRSACDESSLVTASSMLGGLQLRGEWVQRTGPVAFNYFTPLSSPTIDGRQARIASPIEADADTVLVFGMVETEPPKVRTRSLTVDPQQPRDLVNLGLSSMRADRSAVVLNQAEATALAQTSDPKQAASLIRDQYAVDVVVVKLGAIGALVCTGASLVPVGPCPTPIVYPIGSGDVFSAAFAWAWGEDGRDPVEAAHFASMAAAQWCGSPDHIPALDPERVIPELPMSNSSGPTIYLAGPFFSLGELWLVELVRSASRDLGANIFSPLHDVGRGGPEVAEKDLAGLAKCSVVLGMLDGADAGTMFEIGYATHKHCPVVCYAESANIEGRKLLDGTGAEVHGDLSTAVYRAVWAGMGMKLAGKT